MNDALGIDPVSKVFFLENPVDHGYPLMGDSWLIYQQLVKYCGNSIDNISNLSLVKELIEKIRCSKSVSYTGNIASLFLDYLQRHALVCLKLTKSIIEKCTQTTPRSRAI
jgi:hypothetical protein